MTIEPRVALYTTALLSIWGLYLLNRWRRHRKGLALLTESQVAGLTEPTSLHPIIDPAKCLGCGACVRVCPEGDVLNMIDGKAVLVEPTQCIGHGACEAACPRGAISLVFGTAKRGVDIPVVGADFQTNVPGIFIAGELGGMGLIRNAIEQGRQALNSAASYIPARPTQPLDVVIVGAGPAGFAASLAAKEQGLGFVTLEQDSFGGTVAHFPRGKLVMTAPAILPIIGQMRFAQVSKEELLSFWQAAASKTGINIRYGEQVTDVRRDDSGFKVTTTRALYRSKSILLTIGRRGTPRKLGVPGEELSKVVYRLIDAEQYRAMKVLIVGGGDSALEAAASIAEQPGTTVTLAYRGSAFQRAKTANRKRVSAAEATGRLRVRLNTKIMRIELNRVLMDDGNAAHWIANQAVIVCAGGELPTPFLKSIGIEVETKYGTR
jgi:thioredoxin reductase/ferredoxin